MPNLTAVRIALYARVSTIGKGQDTMNQIAQLRAFAAAQGWIVVAEFVDTVTGGTSDRPEFQRMFEAASRREFDCLLFWSLDRLSREGVLATQAPHRSWRASRAWEMPGGRQIGFCSCSEATGATTQRPLRPKDRVPTIPW